MSPSDQPDRHTLPTCINDMLGRYEELLRRAEPPEATKHSRDPEGYESFVANVMGSTAGELLEAFEQGEETGVQIAWETAVLPTLMHALVAAFEAEGADWAATAAIRYRQAGGDVVDVINLLSSIHPALSPRAAEYVEVCLKLQNAKQRLERGGEDPILSPV